MKALTIWQPWASLIAAGAKPYEFRNWPAPKSLVGQRIAIHAAARPVRHDEIEAEIIAMTGPDAHETTLKTAIALPILDNALAGMHLPLSRGLCTAVLGDPTSRIVTAAGEIVDIGNWAWPMLDVQPLDDPEPRRGAQGFWEWGGPSVARMRGG